jgi:hypothetical protein
MFEVVDRDETALGQSRLARRDGRPLELVDMNDAEMHLPDRRRVVVDESDAPQHASASDLDLFIELAPERNLVGFLRRATIGVGLVDMPANTERPQPVQPRLALRHAACVAEDLLLTTEDDVRDNLLEAGIYLDFRSPAKLGDSGD